MAATGYDEPQVWITRGVSWLGERLGSPVQVSILGFGGPVVAALTLYLVARWDAVPLGFRYSVGSLRSSS